MGLFSHPLIACPALSGLFAILLAGTAPRRPMAAREKARGFTLLELIVGLAVAAIVVTMAAPSMTGMVKGSQLSAATSSLATAFNYARIEAVTRNANVRITANSGSDWSQGWAVYDDTNAVMRKFPPVGGTVTITSDNDIGSFTFGSGGRISPGQETISICDDRVNETGRTLTVGVRGRIAVDDLACD